MADGSWTLAVLDGDGVLIAFEIVDDEALWVRSKTRHPVPDNCDLALKRYRLVEWRPGKCRFEPLIHAKDVSAENAAAELAFSTLDIARMISHLNRDGKVSLADETKLADFLQSMDGQG